MRTQKRLCPKGCLSIYTKPYDGIPKQVAIPPPFGAFLSLRGRSRPATSTLTGLPHLEYATGTLLALSTGEQNELSKEMTEGY